MSEQSTEVHADVPERKH